MFLPSAQVTSRECAKFDPSRARQPYTVTVSPTFIVSRVQPCRRSMLGGKPSNFHWTTLPDSSFTSR